MSLVRVVGDEPVIPVLGEVPVHSQDSPGHPMADHHAPADATPSAEAYLAAVPEPEALRVLPANVEPRGTRGTC